MDSSSSFGGQPDFQDSVEQEVNASFIDALSQSMGFSEGDEEYRKGLHAFPKVCLVHVPFTQHRYRLVGERNAQIADAISSYSGRVALLNIERVTQPS